MNSTVDRAAILVVDDEEGIRYFLERFLTREGYQVVTAPSGEAALARLASAEFDVVLLDLKMKGISGLDVLADLHVRWPATSVIILTAHASLESAVEALRRGAHDYLFKPCRTLDLRESIRNGLTKRRELLQLRQIAPNLITPESPAGPIEPAPADRFLQHNGLIVDPIRHIITLDGMLLELSPTEFDLLAYLVSQVPRVVPPQELIREVQGYASDATEAAETIRSHMYHIRRKMQTTSGRSAILTVRGIGYTLVE
jgi:DNA-binding response OmpR family regulator